MGCTDYFACICITVKCISSYLQLCVHYLMVTKFLASTIKSFVSGDAPSMFCCCRPTNFLLLTTILHFYSWEREEQPQSQCSETEFLWHWQWGNGQSYKSTHTELTTQGTSTAAKYFHSQRSYRPGEGDSRKHVSWEYFSPRMWRCREDWHHQTSAELDYQSNCAKIVSSWCISTCFNLGTFLPG